MIMGGLFSPEVSREYNVHFPQILSKNHYNLFSGSLERYFFIIVLHRDFIIESIRSGKKKKNPLKKPKLNSQLKTKSRSLI